MTRNVRNDLNVEAVRDEAAAVRQASNRVREADKTVTVRFRFRERRPPCEFCYGKLEAVEYTVYGKRRVRCENDERYDISELDECPDCGVLMTYLDERTDACIECEGDDDE